MLSSLNHTPLMRSILCLRSWFGCSAKKLLGADDEEDDEHGDIFLSEAIKFSYLYHSNLERDCCALFANAKETKTRLCDVPGSDGEARKKSSLLGRCVNSISHRKFYSALMAQKAIFRGRSLNKENFDKLLQIYSHFLRQPRAVNMLCLVQERLIVSGWNDSRTKTWLRSCPEHHSSAIHAVAMCAYLHGFSAAQRKAHEKKSFGREPRRNSIKLLSH